VFVLSLQNAAAVKTHAPTRSARCGLPAARADRAGGDLLPSEESASLLLWAFPRLLGWHRTVNWLFSPVNSRRRYPGDLWGVDSHGDLLIVETKLTRTGRSQDPFADFVGYGRTDLWTDGHLGETWGRLLDQEREFQRRYPRQFKTPLTATFPGVLPYSRQRDAVGRWQALYREQIVPRLLDNRHQRAVERSLRARKRRGNPPPIFAGLLATVREDQPALSAAGRTAMRKLTVSVGADRVHLQGMKVKRQAEDQLRVQSWTMRP
jgi:hypothetical protein